MTNRRRAATSWDRMGPCKCCRFPLTQRHHVLGFKAHGEGGLVVYLCGTCHDIIHVMERAVNNSRRAHQLLAWLRMQQRSDDDRLCCLDRLVKKAVRLRRKATLADLQP